MSSGRVLGGVLGALTAAAAGVLTYGALVESNRLVIEKHTLKLPLWPTALNGYRIALLADFHVGHEWSLALGKRAIAAALAEAPDMVVLAGDYVNYWNSRSVISVGELLEPLALMQGDVVAVPGNHDYHSGDPDLLDSYVREFGIHLLRNESLRLGGVTWIGLDSARQSQDDLRAAFSKVEHDQPKVVVWHEPDTVDRLPAGCCLQLSGHSHGGQFRLPFGYTPMHSKLGSLYPRGFYSETPTPLYVTRGVGTTGPPSRLLCPPEVSILTLTAG